MTGNKNKANDKAKQEAIDLTLARQLSRAIKLNTRLQARNSLLRKTVEQINAAANQGRVCAKGPAQYDPNTTLADYCESVLRQDDDLKRVQDNEQSAPP